MTRKIKRLLEAFEKNIRADIDDSELDLDRADLLHIREVVNSLIDRELRERE